VEASQNDKNIGQEFDFFLHWKVYNNLFFSAKYGIFFPEGAYPPEKRQPAKYFYTRLRLTF